METFDQVNLPKPPPPPIVPGPFAATTGCMQCHSGVQLNTDFLWSLFINAWPSTIPPFSQHLVRPSQTTAPPLSPELQALKALMQSAVEH
jgi:hypothetical protein